MRVTQKHVLAGASLDLVLGDPQWLPHPIRGLGCLIRKGEDFWRSTGLPLRVSGSLFALSVIVVSSLAVRLTLPRWNVYWIFSLLACRSLDKESSSVIAALQQGQLAEARRRLSFIVGRDTEHLDEQEILRATIETVAENLSDGVVAPLFYLALAGPVGMAAYKAINTLDSMVGYRNRSLPRVWLGLGSAGRSCQFHSGTVERGADLLLRSVGGRRLSRYASNGFARWREPAEP